MNAQHPAVKALKVVVEDVLRPHFERKAKEFGAGGKESRETKQRLNALARIVAKFQVRKAEELEFELSQQSTQGVELTPEVPILEVIPPRKLLEIGKSHTFSVRVRADAVRDGALDAEVLLSVAADPEGCLELSGSSCVLTKDSRLEGRLTGTFVARALASQGHGVIEVSLPGFMSVVVDVEVSNQRRSCHLLLPSRSSSNARLTDWVRASTGRCSSLHPATR